jgi:hypothetical protein
MRPRLHERRTVTTRSSRATLAAMPTAHQSRDTRTTRRPHRAPNYDHKLTRHVVLADGRRLCTLKDVAYLLVDVFGSINARSHALDHAIALLMQAATTGARYDVEATTYAIERVWRARAAALTTAARVRAPYP